MAEQKTTFQNWIDSKYKTQSNFAKEVKESQGNISKEYNSPNGLRKISKYAKRLGIESVDLQGWEYGMYIELKNVKIV